MSIGICVGFSNILDFNVSSTLAAGALENADIRPGEHIRDQPVEAPVEPREMVYDININLPDNMAPVAVNNDRLAANGGAVMVEDVDYEDELYNKDKVEPDAVAQVPPPSPPVAAAMAPRRGSQSHRSGGESTV